MFTDEQIKQLRQVIKEEVNTALEPVTKRLDDLAEMDKQILIEVGEHHNKLEKRVDRIEEHLDFPPLAE